MNIFLGIENDILDVYTKLFTAVNNFCPTVQPRLGIVGNTCSSTEYLSTDSGTPFCVFGVDVRSTFRQSEEENAPGRIRVGGFYLFKWQ